MRVRTRLQLAMAAVALVPLALLLVAVRREMTARLLTDEQARTGAVVQQVDEGLNGLAAMLERRMSSLVGELNRENRFRMAVLQQEPAAQQWLRQWSGSAMASAGLEILHLQDSSGMILTSGHFRNQFGQPGPALPPSFHRAPFVARVLAAESTLTVLAMVREFAVAGRTFELTGGIAFDSVALARLAPGSDLRLLLDPAVAAQGGDSTALVRPYPLADLGGGTPGDSARVMLVRDRSGYLALRRGVDRWFFAAVGITLLVALALASWLASLVSRPIAALARQTAAVDLDQPDQEFPVRRDDEIGDLARHLDAMTSRLRQGVARLRESERRAAMGDVARQINHDIKNGLAPIRHVLRHLGQVAADDPAKLASIYRERQPTLESSVEYLDTLARNYARLSPVVDRTLTDPAAVLRDIGRTVPAAVTVEWQLPPTPVLVRADPVVLRRIVENLVTNGIEAMEGVPAGAARLVLACERTNGPDPRVRLSIADRGRGMTREELDRAFDDFFTTREGGTGLGLSVVRRLVSDLGGTLRVETAPGQGSRFLVELAAAEPILPGASP